MTNRSKKPAASKSKMPGRASIFGPPPILEGEDAQAYNELLASISGAVKPSDTIEELWVCDIVDLTWEIFRYRRIKTNFLADELRATLKTSWCGRLGNQKNLKMI